MQFKMINEDSHGIYEKAYRLWCNIKNERNLFDWCNFEKSNTSLGNFPKDQLYLKKQFIQDVIASFNMEAWVHRPRSSSSSDARELVPKNQSQIFIEDQVIPFLESIVRAIDNQINRYAIDGSEQNSVIFPVFSSHSLISLLRSHYNKEFELGNDFKLSNNTSDTTQNDLITYAARAMPEYNISVMLNGHFVKDFDVKLSSHKDSTWGSGAAGYYDAACESPASTPLSVTPSPVSPGKQ